MFIVVHFLKKKKKKKKKKNRERIGACDEIIFSPLLTDKTGLLNQFEGYNNPNQIAQSIARHLKIPTLRANLAHPYQCLSLVKESVTDGQTYAGIRNIPIVFLQISWGS